MPRPHDFTPIRAGYYRDQHGCEIHVRQGTPLLYLQTRHDAYRYPGPLEAFLADPTPVCQAIAEHD